jgi:hypothetical protein
MNNLIDNNNKLHKKRVKFALEKATKAQRWSSGISLLFFNFGARWGCVVNATLRLIYIRERPSTRYIGGWVGPKAGLDRCEILAVTGILSPDRPASSESLYRLNYPDPRKLPKHYHVHFHI